MKLSTIILLLFTLLSTSSPSHAYPEVHPYNQNWYVRVDKSEAANADRKKYDPPAVGQQAKELNKFQRILLLADKRHPSRWYRYYPHISNREYEDCRYYKYVDCSNYTFCRCWQCRDYAYSIVRSEY